MTRIRLMIVGLLAVFSVSAVSASSALATPKCEAGDVGTDFTVCAKASGGAQREFESPGKLEGISGESILEATVGGLTVKIVCEEDRFVDTPEDSGTSTGTITFENCKVALPTSCKLPAGQAEKIVANFTNALEAPPKVTFTGSGPGNEFVSLNLENNGGTCVPAGAYTITGNTKTGCTFDKNTAATAETFKLEHKLECKKAGEELKLGTNVATFSSTAGVWLAGLPLEKWAILES
jgi:hypothetical protein